MGGRGEGGDDQYVAEDNVYSFLDPSWRPSSSIEDRSKQLREDGVISSLLLGNKTLAVPGSSIKNALSLVKSKRNGGGRGTSHNSSSSTSTKGNSGKSTSTADDIMADLKREETERLAVYNMTLKSITDARPRANGVCSVHSKGSNNIILQNSVRHSNVSANPSVAESWSDLTRLEEESNARIKHLHEE